MAIRIVGVDLPQNKRGEIALTLSLIHICEGESGRRKMNQYTRYLTIAILLVQAPSYLLNLMKHLRKGQPAF